MSFLQRHINIALTRGEELMRHLTWRVRAAQEELDLVIKFHEAFKSAAFETGLHQRLTASFAAHAFGTILEALQREVVMALMRVWD